MFLRMFLNGRIAPLLMSGTGASDGGAGGGGGGDPASAAAAAAAGGAPAVLSFSPDRPFVEQLPEKYRGEVAFKDIKNFEGLADSYLSAQKMVGADKVALPKDGDEKGWADLYNKLGRPESADKYAVGKRADGSDYGDQDKAFQAKILPALHEAGVTQKQLDKIRPVFDSLMAEAAGAGTKAAEVYAAKQQEGLKAKLGAAYDETMANAQEALTHYAGEGASDLFNELNIIKDGKATGDNAALLLIFGKLGKQLREDGVIGRGGENQGGAMDPAAAQSAIKAKQADKDFMAKYGKKDHPEHAQAVEEMRKLYEFAYPPQ